MAGTRQLVFEFLGDKALHRTLRGLSDKSVNNAASAGIRASMTPLRRALRAAINTVDAGPAMKRAARASIGSRFRRTGRRDRRGAKAGFAVGKKQEDTIRVRKGVGASAKNIHWFVLGTKERITKAGKKTGAVPNIFDGVAGTALRASEALMLAAARAKITQVIEREAVQLRKRNSGR